MQDGLILIDKPTGITSNSAIQQVKQYGKFNKIGHAGTLDPLATGLLLAFTNEATKFIQYLMCDSKEYLATARLGIVTDTGDSDGQTIQQATPQTTYTQLLEACNSMIGERLQIPPDYSAIKYYGQPLYKYARQGITVTKTTRKIIIHELELLDHDLLSITFRAKVSAGTYIRVLAQEIAEAAGCIGATITALRRTFSGKFCIENACSISTLKQAQIIPLADFIPLQRYYINMTEFAAIKNGHSIVPVLPELFVDSQYALYFNTCFLGTAIVTQTMQLQPVRLLANLPQMYQKYNSAML